MLIDINRLKQNREEILKAEIGSLLFNLGKTHIGIGNWRNYFPNETQLFSKYKEYYEQNHFEQELENISPQLKNFIFDTDVNINGENKKWVEYFKGDVSGSDIVKKVFFRGCENVNSGIDKGSPKEQIQGSLWIANAFGGYLDNVKNYNFDDRRKCFFIALDEECKKNNWYNNPKWEKLRNFILANVKSWYLNILSDSRFPVNDVTLWDQAYMSATMFKAALAGMVLNTNESQNYISNPQSIRWHILGVQYDKLALAEKALKVPIIKWYRETAKELDEKIKKIIEVEYPLGNEIYRDETGIYFFVPEGIKLEDIACIKSKILSEFQCIFNDEIYPYIGFTKSSRGTMNLTNLLEKAKENFLEADYSLKSSVVVEKNAIEICQICKSRLVERDDTKDDIRMCDICKRRKEGRIDTWLEQQKGETIWISELADKNNRIALVTLKFELMEWLNGDLLSSLLVREENFNNQKNNLFFLLQNTKSFYSNLINNSNIDNFFNQNNRQLLEFYRLFDNAIKTVFNLLINKIQDILNKTFDDINNEITQLETYLINGNLSRNQQKNLNFLKQLPNLKAKYNLYINIFNFLPLQYNRDGTFTILHNFTQNDIKNIITFIYFYEQILNLFVERSIGDKWEKFIKNNLSDETAIDFDSRKINCDKFNNNDLEFLSKVILQFLLRKNPSPARLRRIWESTEEFFKEVKSDVLDNITAYRPKDSFVRKVPDFKNLKDQIEEQEYKQYFSIIDPTPISWQFVIPAEKVEEVIDKIQKLYYKNFKYVNGKLPLHIGVVVQNYKKPLYIGIKALRNIRRDIKSWREIKREGIDLLEDLSCYFDSKETNNNARDFYSLYETNNPDYDFYLLPSGKGVKKYSDSDSFVIYPNTFDFEFLDSNARRNDIYYKDGKRLTPLKQNRSYTWKEWKYFKNFRDEFKNSSNKLQTIVSLIYSKMEDWKYNEDSFKKLMQTTFKKENIDIKKFGIKDFSFDEMKKFLDMFEFWHTALKEI